MPVNSERERLAQAYARRDAARMDQVGWSPLRLEAQWLDAVTQRWIMAAVAGQGWTPSTIGSCRVLEIGCGTGRVLRWLEHAGVGALAGCDALPARAAQAAKAAPSARVLEAEMSRLPYGDASFDCVVQVMVFSSCLNAETRRRGAREMLRVVKPGGCIIWCDAKPGRGEPDYLRGVGAREVRELFSGAAITFRHLGAKPALLGRLVSLANLPKGCRAAKQFPLLAASFLEYWPWTTGYLGAVVRRTA